MSSGVEIGQEKYVMNHDKDRGPGRPAAVQSLVASRYTAYAALVLVLVLNCAIRFHLRNIPLERDEGEYAYAGQLMLQGIPPYKLAYNMKLPGTYVAYTAILAIFGQTPAGVHLGLLVVNSVTVLLIFLLALRLEGLTAAACAGASYAVLSVTPTVLGFACHATHFVVLMAMAGFLLLLKGLDDDGTWLIFGSGVFFGLAFLMKQPGLLLAIFGALYLVRTELKNGIGWKVIARKAGVFSGGAALPFVLTCLWLWRVGVFKTFWFWTVSYASQYVTNWGLNDGLHLLATTFPTIIGPAVWIWLIAGVGAAALMWDQELRPHAFFVLGFLLFSFLAVCPGLFFREHYFILMLPAVAILAGLGVTASVKAIRRRSRIWRFAPAMALVAALGWCFYAQRDFFFKDDPITISRKIYGGNPFPEAIPIADYIRHNTAGNSTIAVLGSEPEIYFYAHRHSATGYIYTYGLMEEQKYALKMQQQMISEIEASRPQVLVWVNVRASWLPHQHSEGRILSWAEKYVHDNYRLTGVADIHATATDYRFGDSASTYQPRSNSVVFVFMRSTS
jgi:4-amino-4-deoxy-L-arabinose transferase-like glycosyltransferase